MRHCGIGPTYERLKAKPFAFNLDQCGFFLLRCHIVYSFSRFRPFLLLLLGQSLVLKFDSALFDDIKVGRYGPEIKDYLPWEECFDLKKSNQIEHVPCEERYQLEMSLINQIYSNKSVLATNPILIVLGFTNFIWFAAYFFHSLRVNLLLMLRKCGGCLLGGRFNLYA